MQSVTNTPTNENSVALSEKVKSHFSVIMQWSFIASSLKRCEKDRFIYHSNYITFNRDELFAALIVIKEDGFDNVMESMVGQTFDFSALRRYTLSSVSPHEIEMVRSATVWV